MRYVIRTAISHGHIKQEITTVGSHGCIIKGTYLLRDGASESGEGGHSFEKKHSFFPYSDEKIKMSSTKLKIKSLFFIQ